MRWLRATWTRLRDGAQARAEFEAELESHIAMHVDDAMRRGLTQEQARREASIDRRRQIKALLDQHVNEALWRELLRQARLAARAGDKEFLLLRFPSDLCSDGGRKIDVAEPGWEETLRGEAAEVYDRWKKELRPNGFGLSARVVSYVDGVLGDIGLFLSWGI